MAKKTVETYRDRIQGLVHIPVERLRACPYNFRKHGKKQRAGLKAILREVGIAAALLARKLPGKGEPYYMLIDGHMRREEYPPGQEVPVLVLDIDEAEHRKLLATLDPLAAQAEVDPVALAGVLETLETGEQALSALFSELSEAHGVKPTDLSLDLPDGDEDEEEEEPEETPTLKNGKPPEKEAPKAPPKSPVKKEPPKPAASPVRMTQLYLTDDTFSRYCEMVEVIQESVLGPKSSATDCVMKALEEYTKTLSRGEEEE